ncbi:uncharacterized protein [Oryctolagus cuniculus]|uniref:Uncharacterized protein n=1 Tax=Oryctolagus cuniculus TaxID=9986 RepID=G1U2L5_RABIT|nr:uncharacterized protein LOC100340079 [Oryctolagus cuniculus]XP_008263941.1 uncharacterized protein LOC100340079 [Oryctolagus cuniculus]XP_008263942.1 uncharacterized protein LOC100340079 [Oryctolagus cuniculus]XP_008263944.1 uncharacterized protein LOC100340079 [Oryctolagus cuniculus]XP_008263945.1 uncharacterized protein LOC100340079 [Oryctolagus cuniculus]XP_008263946.1 uncharacterized protein LOC100340079 [Oryctolagus cuniculus]XP_051712680.1 uncharacterized protein LOC100340079 [Orycto
MSGRQVSHSNAHSRLRQPYNASFPARAPGWTQSPSLNGANSLKRPRTPSGSEFSSCSSHSDRSFNPGSPRLPLRKICMGRPYNSKCVETSHLASHRNVAKKPAYRSSPHCLLCTDRPSDPSSPTFLDQLIKGINYLDRSTNAFYNSCPKSLSLPRLAANYLERAANSLYLDHLEQSAPRTYSSPSASVPCPDTSTPSTPSTCMVPSPRGASALQCLGEPSTPSCQCQPPYRSLTPVLPQRSGIKLPEIPLFGNGLFSLGRLPKFWEAIRSGWSAPEPIPKPSSWW